VAPDGRRWGHITDETPQRGFYREWRSVMFGDPAADDMNETHA
jgi:hypothetical protein